MGQGGTIPSWAVRGARVVCVDDTEDAFVPRLIQHGLNPIGTLDGLVAGQVYTIRTTGTHFVDDIPVVRLMEIRRSIEPDGMEAAFALERFRPLITRTQEQDVDRFRKHLHPKRIRTDAIVKIPHHGPVS